MTLLPSGQAAPAVQTEAVVRDRRHLRASLLIGLCCLLVYNANWRAISAGDTYPARYLPFAIWQHQTLFLDPVASVTAQGRGDRAFWMVRLPDGHLISLYPVVVPVLLAPLYLAAVGYLHMRGWTDARLDRVARLMEKLSASLVAALSASLLYLLLRRRAAAQIALLLTVAYAFGTTTWVISSQALWQHGMGQLLVIGALLLLTGPCTAPRALGAGLLLGLVAVNRPPDVIIAAALPVGLVLLYNLGVAGNIAGAYGLKGRAAFFKHDLLSGVAGLLVSPTRGLFVFSPFLLFLFLAGRHLPRNRAERGLTLAMSVAVLLQLLLYAKADWRSGVAWGPRFMTDLLPLLIWMLVPVVAALRGVLRTGFVLAVGVAVAIEAIGAFCYTGATDWWVLDTGPHKMRGAWRLGNAPFVGSLRQGLAPAELTTRMQGSFDAIEADGRPASAVTAGREAVATGWAHNALAGRNRHRRRRAHFLPHSFRPRRGRRRLEDPVRHCRPRSRPAPSQRLCLGRRERRATLPGGAQADGRCSASRTRAGHRRESREELQEGCGPSARAPAGGRLLADCLHERDAVP